MYGLKEGEPLYPWLWPVPEGRMIGKRRVPRVDGYEKASGSAVYTRDIYRPGMLYAKFLRSPHAHAKIKRLDTSKAEALQGVRAVLRYDDPGIEWPKLSGQALVSDTNHWYEGMVGAVVVGESEAIVDRALRLIGPLYRKPDGTKLLSSQQWQRDIHGNCDKPGISGNCTRCAVGRFQ